MVVGRRRGVGSDGEAEGSGREESVLYQGRRRETHRCKRCLQRKTNRYLMFSRHGFSTFYLFRRVLFPSFDPL